MSADDTVLVTGASGFVGSAVARQLVARGCKVRALVRPASPRTNLDGLPLELAQGDMADPAAMARALKGARYLFHVAADYRLWAPEPEEIVRNNLAGTRTVMRAALEAGVERVVYTSSVATLRPEVPGDETGPLREDEAIGAYKRSKVVAERLVERMVAEAGLPAVIVNPSTPIGPRDVKPTPTGRIIVEAATGRIPAFVETGLNLVHVDDVAQGHLLALDKGRIGERYVLGGQDVPLRRMLADIAHLAGRKAPTLSLPRAPLYPLAHLAEAIGRITGKEPMLTVDALKMAGHHMYFRSTKAERELGYVARPYIEGIADALAWFGQRQRRPMMATILFGWLPLTLWAYLVLGRGMFWRARERDDRDEPQPPASWPSVVAVVPARDEADVVARSIGSLLAQDYPGEFRVILVDDFSADGTADFARKAAEAQGRLDRLEILTGQPLAPGWTGKLWAVSQGVDHAAPAAPDYLLLTDADIGHAPGNLRGLVARAQAGQLSLASLMVKLHCQTFAERSLIPAFVFFFDMLYPFAWVNDPKRRVAAAAGGCMLVDWAALARAGGVAAIRAAIIDDCALGRLMKAQGPIWLGLTNRAWSLRPYRTIGEIGRMVSRSAYAQLNYSPLLLAGTLAGMGLTYLAPVAMALFGHGIGQLTGFAAWGLMTLSFQPMLKLYGRTGLWGLTLPAIGAAYTAFTVASAVQVWRGRGGMWKGRAQALGQVQ